ncbi:hypothetical protein GCK32_012460 [Trichostrongylus colubriformis]|uniref:Core Histone H2A/H2B/H3 domain-containing protein n=1 Tax=Trichostrongylus colubriformis TaxID=6319 RepID=A0AAN8INX8_TRICO
MTVEPNYARPLGNRSRHYAEQERYPSNSRMNGTRGEYMAPEREYNSRPMRKEQNHRQRIDPSFSQNSDGPNEYMTDRSYARPTDNRSKQYIGEESRSMSKSRTAGARNEYMVEEPEYSNCPVQREQYSRQRMDPSFSRNFDGTSEYMTERSYARPTDNRSRQLDDRENLYPSYSRAHESRNEYMVNDLDDHLNSYRRKPSYKNPQHRTERVAMKGLQVNEYMTDHREAPLEVPRDSSIPMVPNIREEDDDASLSNLKRFPAAERRMMSGDEFPPERAGGSRKMVYRDFDEIDRRAAGPSRRSGGTPRFGAKALPRMSMKRRHRPGALALKEIRKFQKLTCHLIPKLPLQRVIREVVQELYPNSEYRFAYEACDALQEV